VRGHEVDAGGGAAALPRVQVGTAGHPGGDVAEHPALATPQVADRVAVLAVPLRPQRREVADLVPALADVPGLGDELHPADDRVLLDQVEERRQSVDVVELAGQRRGEVETEPVDVHLGHPVAEAVHDELQRAGVPHVEGVPRAREVAVVPRFVVHQPVVRVVVEALEREHRSEVVALGGVVEHDVEDHLQAGLVEVAHHRLELAGGVLGAGRRGVAGVRGEEPDRVVPPVVAEALLDEMGVVDEVVHRLELDRRDAEIGEVPDDLGVGQAGVGAA